MIKALRHTGLVVKDPERSLYFYRDLLGFKVLKDALEHGTFIEHILGIPDVKVRTIKMSCGEEGVLELLCFDGDSLTSGGKKLFLEGFSHIALTVSDLDGLYSHLQDQGVSFIARPEISVDGKAKVAFCRDFEGNSLELVQEFL